MAYSVNQVEKHTLFMRLAVSVYKMDDEQLHLLLKALDQNPVPDRAISEPSGTDMSLKKSATIKRQMMVARIFVLISQLDRDTILDRLKGLEDPAYNWVRVYPRLACYLLVDFAAQGKAYRSYIRDISANGVFIETTESFEEGQVVALCFTLSESNDTLPFKVRGRVTQTYPDGIGVQYEKMTYYQREILDTLINKIY